MAEKRLFRLRVTFCKQGRLALLSHLEVARALERAVRRAGLPYAVSQGFSPHMKIAFGAALPWGWAARTRSSTCSWSAMWRPSARLPRCRRQAWPTSWRSPVATGAFRSGGLGGVSREHLPRAPVVRARGVSPAARGAHRAQEEGEAAFGGGLPGGGAVAGRRRGHVLAGGEGTGSLRPDVLLAAGVEACNAGGFRAGGAGGGRAVGEAAGGGAVGSGGQTAGGGAVGNGGGSGSGGDAMDASVGGDAAGGGSGGEACLVLAQSASAAGRDVPCGEGDRVHVVSLTRIAQAAEPPAPAADAGQR